MILGGLGFRNSMFILNKQSLALIPQVLACEFI